MSLFMPTNFRHMDIREDQVLDCWKCVADKSHMVCVNVLMDRAVWEKTIKAMGRSK